MALTDSKSGLSPTRGQSFGDMPDPCIKKRKTAGHELFRLKPRVLPSDVSYIRHPLVRGAINLVPSQLAEQFHFKYS